MTMLPEFVDAVPLSEAELQVRIQDVVNREWPQWKRERALRVGGDEKVALDAFFDAMALEVDAARIYQADLAVQLAAAAAVAAAEAAESAALAAAEAAANPPPADVPIEG
jgi:hypothetical protein